MRTEAGEPCVVMRRIPTKKWHLKGFAHVHPMEKVARTMLSPDLMLGIASLETYHLEQEDIGKVIINVTGIKKGLVNGDIRFQMVELALTQEWVEYIMETCHTEEEGIARHTLEDLKRPGIMIAWNPDASFTSQIDGSHRLVRRWREGMKTMELAMVYLPFVLKHIARPDETDKFFTEVL
jgi:hypothetical protein